MNEGSQRGHRNTYDLRTALSLAGSTLAVAVVLGRRDRGSLGESRGDGGEGSNSNEDGLELHFESVGLGQAEELKRVGRV